MKLYRKSVGLGLLTGLLALLLATISVAIGGFYLAMLYLYAGRYALASLWLIGLAMGCVVVGKIILGSRRHMSYQYVDVTPHELTVHWPQRDLTYGIPSDIVNIEYPTSDEVWIIFKNGYGTFKLSNAVFAGDRDEVDMIFNDTFPMVLVDAAGEIVGKASCIGGVCPEGCRKYLKC